MTLLKAIRAYEVCGQLAGEKTDMQTAYALARLMGQLEGHGRFYAEKELEILADCGEMQDGRPVVTGGKVKLLKPEEYARRMQELNNVEVEQPQPVRLAFEQVTAAQVMALGELVTW